jgi:hypothetical protein
MEQETERRTERRTNKQTDRQREDQTDRQTDRQTRENAVGHKAEGAQSIVDGDDNGVGQVGEKIARIQSGRARTLEGNRREQKQDKTGTEEERKEGENE